jgi:7-carboxy-7-deazaguanine synthase
MNLPVSEIFGPTIQGEGEFIGIRAIFVRFFGCDTKCGWCDTQYSWSGTVSPRVMDEIEIMKRIAEMDEEAECKVVVLTGGNPAIHDLSVLVDLLDSAGFEIHVETQGTIIPEWFRDVDVVTISPKGSVMDIPRIVSAIEKVSDMTEVESIRGMLGPYIVLKMVIGDPGDYEVARLLNAHFPNFVMVLQPKWTPEGGGMTLREIADMVTQDGKWSPEVRVLPQLHRLIWGDGSGF